MRDNLERVNIVLTKEQHVRFKEFARRFHGSLSQFMRMAAENQIIDDSGIDDLKLRPIVEELEKIRDSVQKINVRLRKMEKGTDFVVEKLGSKNEKVADDIERLLLEKGIKLSIPEIGNYLPYSQDEVISGMERLESDFVVSKIPEINAPSKWIIRGCEGYDER